MSKRRGHNLLQRRHRPQRGILLRSQAPDHRCPLRLESPSCPTDISQHPQLKSTQVLRLHSPVLCLRRQGQAACHLHLKPERRYSNHRRKLCPCRLKCLTLLQQQLIPPTEAHHPRPRQRIRPMYPSQRFCKAGNPPSPTFRILQATSRMPMPLISHATSGRLITLQSNRTILKPTKRRASGTQQRSGLQLRETPSRRQRMRSGKESTRTSASTLDGIIRSTVSSKT